MGQVHLAMAACGLMAGGVGAVDGVKIEKVGQEFAVTAPAYTARVDGGGSLASLAQGVA